MKTILEWGYSLVIGVAAALCINIFLAQHMVVEGHSMDPTLRHQEHLVVSKVQHVLRQMPDYGDIVIIDSRVQRERSFKDDLVEPVQKLFGAQEYIFIKRVIGKPGDVLEFKAGEVFRNGEKLSEPYILDTTKFPSDRKVVVSQNSVFVMGDNRNNSLDSRLLGDVPVDHVIGKLFWQF